MSEPLIRSITPTQSDLGDRVDKVIPRYIEDISRSTIQKLLIDKNVQQEGQTLKTKTKLKSLAPIELSIPPIPDSTLIPWPTQLDILYEDEHMVAVNKASGVVIHPGSGTGDHTLVHALLHHCGDKLSQITAPERPGIVHRLDKETTGVIICAKNDTAHLNLSRMFAKRTLEKSYYACVAQIPTEHSGSIQEPIERHPVIRTRMSVQAGGRPAHTDWTLARKASDFAILNCRIHTGRTHQIRVHLSHIGHPLLGDNVYGFKSKILTETLQPPRVLLHAHSLKFLHPITQAPMSLCADLPDDFQYYWDLCQAL